MKSVELLEKFVKSGRYSKNVAHSIGTALRVLGAGLNNRDKDSVQYFEENLDQIAKRVYMKSEESISVESLSTYKIRMRRLFRDYKFSSMSKDKAKNSPIKSSKSSYKNFSENQRIELSLRPDAKFVLILPKIITRQENEIIKSVLDSLQHK